MSKITQTHTFLLSRPLALLSLLACHTRVCTPKSVCLASSCLQREAFLAWYAGIAAAEDAYQALAGAAYAQVVGPAKVIWVGAYSAAKLTYVTAQSTAHVAVVTAVANSTAAYRTQEAAALYTALVDLATEHPSPWATYTRDKVGAWHDYVAATAPARAAYEIALAEAQAAWEIAQAGGKWGVARFARQIWQHGRGSWNDKAAIRTSLCHTVVTICNR